MPSLKDLPAELRLKIYALALVPTNITKIAAYPRENASDHYSNEVALLALESGQTQRKPHDKTALLRVSKEVSAEARPLLYGSFHFFFLSMRAFELFLEQIGPMKKHLRHVALGPNAYEHDIGPQGPLFAATKRSFTMLAEATGLQTFGISHFDFCRGNNLSKVSIGFDDLVVVAGQLLQAIHCARNAGGLKSDLAGMLDIVRFDLPDCAGSYCCEKSGMQRPERRSCVDFKQYSPNRFLRCYCKCSKAERNNEELNKELKRCVTAYLEL